MEAFSYFIILYRDVFCSKRSLTLYSAPSLCRISSLTRRISFSEAPSILISTAETSSSYSRSSLIFSIGTTRSSLSTSLLIEKVHEGYTLTDSTAAAGFEREIFLVLDGKYRLIGETNLGFIPSLQARPVPAAARGTSPLWSENSPLRTCPLSGESCSYIASTPLAFATLCLPS